MRRTRTFSVQLHLLRAEESLYGPACSQAHHPRKKNHLQSHNYISIRTFRYVTIEITLGRRNVIWVVFRVGILFTKLGLHSACSVGLVNFRISFYGRDFSPGKKEDGV